MSSAHECRVRTRALVISCLLGCATLAHAHGGLPVSQKILRQANGDTMYIPVVYWGLWVGKAGGPWTWICEELINNYRFRRFALSSDGVFYTTNQQGITLSTDHGCTWVNATGAIAQLHTTDVDVDPSDGMTAYVSTGDGGTATADGGVIPASNAVFVTHDHGTTWTPLAGLAAASARLFQSVRVAPSSSSRLYVSSAASQPPFSVTVHRSSDGGSTFTDLPLGYMLDGNAPHLFEVMTIDPRNPDVLYGRAVADINVDMVDILRHALLRSVDGGATWSELLKVDGVTEPSGQTRGIDGVAVDTAKGIVYVATHNGLYSGSDPSGGAPSFTLAPTGTLMQTQCVDVHSGALYACASQFVDHAAIAESLDGAHNFKSVMNYVDTVGPINCPLSTPVGAQCPAYWYMYGSQLGISFDGGVPDGGAPVRHGGGCSCEVGGASNALGSALLALLVLGLVVRTVASSAARARRRG
jgi:MYXO-CTERM domain-containing protein